MKKLFLFFLLYFVFINSSQALIEVDITRGNLDPLPIAVSPLHVDIQSKDYKDINIKELGNNISEIIENNFNLSPRGIREMLKLNNPIYEVTAAYGHFGRKPTNKGEFTWEKTDKTDLFKL